MKRLILIIAVVFSVMLVQAQVNKTSVHIYDTISFVKSDGGFFKRYRVSNLDSSIFSVKIIQNYFDNLDLYESSISIYQNDTIYTIDSVFDYENNFRGYTLYIPKTTESLECIMDENGHITSMDISLHVSKEYIMYFKEWNGSNYKYRAIIDGYPVKHIKSNDVIFEVAVEEFYKKYNKNNIFNK